jgi:hypothetical protein
MQRGEQETALVEDLHTIKKAGVKGSHEDQVHKHEESWGMEQLALEGGMPWQEDGKGTQHEFPE